MCVGWWCWLVLVWWLVCCRYWCGVALGASAWWHVVLGSRPSFVEPGVARVERQEVVVSAARGDFSFEDSESHVSDEEAPIPFNASAVQVQEALEGLYGAGNVEVVEGEGNVAGGDPYVIVLRGAWLISMSRWWCEIVFSGTAAYFL